MAETETPVEHPTPAAAPKKRRAPARRKRSSRKPSARRKKAPGRSRARSTSTTKSFAALLEGWAAKAAAAGKSLKTLSGQGTDAARQAFHGAGAASKKTIARLAKEWENLDTKRRTQFIAALLAALAAASAPVVRNRMKR